MIAAILPVAAVTIGVPLAFVAVRRATALASAPPAFSPVLLTALIVGTACWYASVPIARFEALAWPLRWALGPAIVSLAAVVHASRVALRAQLGALLVAVVGGTLVGIASALLLARALGLGPLLTAALATKTVTTPFAILIQTRLGGPVGLAAAVAVFTGVVGAVLVPPLLRACGIRGSAATGLAIGVSAHIVGTDAIARRDPRAAAFAGGATVLAGVIAAVVLPFAWPWLHRLLG